MTTRQDFVDYIAAQSGLGARLAFRRMFGEYAVYVDGKVVALACDDGLFVKPTPAVEALVPGAPREPPYPGARLYARVDEWLDDPDRLRALLVATADAMPAPKAKAPRRPAAKRAR